MIVLLPGKATIGGSVNLTSRSSLARNGASIRNTKLNNHETRIRTGLRLLSTVLSTFLLPLARSSETLVAESLFQNRHRVNLYLTHCLVAFSPELSREEHLTTIRGWNQSPVT
jgi:hypothetical protein